MTKLARRELILEVAVTLRVPFVPNGPMAHLCRLRFRS